jgi:hypothetical protein
MRYPSFRQMSECFHVERKPVSSDDAYRDGASERCDRRTVTTVLEDGTDPAGFELGDG